MKPWNPPIFCGKLVQSHIIHIFILFLLETGSPWLPSHWPSADATTAWACTEFMGYLCVGVDLATKFSSRFFLCLAMDVDMHSIHRTCRLYKHIPTVKKQTHLVSDWRFRGTPPISHRSWSLSPWITVKCAIFSVVKSAHFRTRKAVPWSPWQVEDWSHQWWLTSVSREVEGIFGPCFIQPYY